MTPKTMNPARVTAPTTATATITKFDVGRFWELVPWRFPLEPDDPAEAVSTEVEDGREELLP